MAKSALISSAPCQAWRAGPSVLRDPVCGSPQLFLLIDRWGRWREYVCIIHTVARKVRETVTSTPDPSLEYKIEQDTCFNGTITMRLNFPR